MLGTEIDLMFSILYAHSNGRDSPVKCRMLASLREPDSFKISSALKSCSLDVSLKPRSIMSKSPTLRRSELGGGLVDPRVWNPAIHGSKE